MGNRQMTKCVATLRPQEAIRAGRLDVVPLATTEMVKARYVLLDEAIGRGRLMVTEVNEQGSVPYLQAVNKGPWPVLIFDGEELVGAKQNRITNATILVAVGKTVLPVSCVEQGRWSRRSHAFTAGAYTSQPGLRSRKERQVRERMQAAGPLAVSPKQYERASARMADQGAVWNMVEDYSRSVDARSSTGALSDAYRAREDDVETLLAALRPVPGMVGASVFLDGRFLCLDVLRPQERFAQLFAKLARGYAFEAVAHPARRRRSVDPEAETLRLLADLMEADVRTGPAVDLGEDLRLETARHSGAGLSWDGEVLQLSVFPKA